MHKSEGPSSVKITHAPEGVQKGEPSNAVDGNINWYSQYGEQYGGSLKKKKLSYHMIQQFHSWVYIQKKTKTQIRKDTRTHVHSSTI